MPKTIEGMLNGSGKKFAIAVSRFNELITRKLLDGAIDGLVRHGVNPDDITVVWTPGAFEIPLVCKKLATAKNGNNPYDGVIALSAIIRGSTPHFDFVSAEISKGVAHVSLESGIPVIFGVLTTDSIEQAIERAGTKAGNKGFDAAMTAIEMVNLTTQI